MNQKSVSSIVLVVTAVVIIGVVGLLVWNSKNSPSSVQESTSTNQPSNTNQNKQESTIETQVRNAVERVLSQGTLPNPNEQMPQGIKLLSVNVNKNKITLSFSKEITSKGQGVFEDTFSLISNAIHPIIQGDGIDPKYPELNFTVLIEGKSASEIF